MKKFLIFYIAGLISVSALADIPEGIISLGVSPELAVFVVDKSQNILTIYVQKEDHIQKVLEMASLTGQHKGPKEIQGDHRTPEGIYWLSDFLSRQYLVQKYGKYVSPEYGVGAFVLDYPNPIDRMFSRSGGGIWVHAKDEDMWTENPYTTRGCVAVTNDNFEQLSKFVNLNGTPVIIYSKVPYVNEEAARLKSEFFKDIILRWSVAWMNKDLEQYMTFYHQKHFEGKGLDWSGWRRYKSKLFAKYPHIYLNLSDIQIYQYDDYVYVQFQQEFITDLFRDKGWKRLLLQDLGDQQFKIISEQFFEPYKLDRAFNLVQKAKHTNAELAP